MLWLPVGDGLVCLPLEGKGDRLRWMRCSRNAALHGDGKRMLRILHLIRHVPCHLLLKEKASVAVTSCEQTVHLRHPTMAGGGISPLRQRGIETASSLSLPRREGEPLPYTALDGIKSITDIAKSTPRGAFCCFIRRNGNQSKV